MKTKPVCDCWRTALNDGNGIRKGEFCRIAKSEDFITYGDTNWSFRVRSAMRKWDDTDRYCPICGTPSEEANQLDEKPD